MMKRFMLVVALSLLCGCANRRYIQYPDGRTEVISNTLFVRSAVVAVSAGKTGLKIGSAASEGDDKMLQAVAAGVIAGMKAGAGVP